MQKIFIIGFVGRDPEERVTAGGKKVVSFPVCVNCKKQGEELRVWYKISSWEGQNSNIISHVKKGSCVVVIGDLSPPTTYQSKKGDISVDLSVNAQSIAFGPSSKKEKEEGPDIVSFEGGNWK